MNPRLRRRNKTRSVGDRSSTFVPSTDSSPAVRSSSPAMIEINVVLPQPLGPTRKLSSPNRVSKLTPRSASTLASPLPKCFLSSRQTTPARLLNSDIGLPPKNRRRLQHQDLPDAENARHDHHEEHARAGQRHALPHEDDPARRQLV